MDSLIPVRPETLARYIEWFKLYALDNRRATSIGPGPHVRRAFQSLQRKYGVYNNYQLAIKLRELGLI
jgi:hypothetical protein